MNCTDRSTANSILIIGLVWPEPTSTAAGGRMLQLIHFFLAHNFNVVFASTAQETVHSYPLDTLGVAKNNIQLNDESFDTFIKNINPNFVLFDRFITEEQFGWRVAKQLPNATRILDTEDLHSLRNARESAFKSQQEFTINYWLQQEITKREIASIYRCDISLIISSYEYRLLKEALKIPEILLLHLPFMLKSISQEDQAKWEVFENRSDFICIGNGKHAPNIDAFIWLKKTLWPAIKQRIPQAKLHVYGSYLPAQILQFHNEKEAYYVHGKIANVSTVMNKARINIAPLRFGAGIKGKLVDSMQYGTPNITTSIGAEGMANTDWSGLIADNPETITQAAEQLYHHKAIWSKAQANGVEIIHGWYNKEVLEDRLYTVITAVQEQISLHRSQNFIGSMLQHHNHASTMYMAKWIMAKNARP